jgi:hypothetical protein
MWQTLSGWKKAAGLVAALIGAPLVVAVLLSKGFRHGFGEACEWLGRWLLRSTAIPNLVLLALGLLAVAAVVFVVRSVGKFRARRNRLSWRADVFRHHFEATTEFLSKRAEEGGRLAHVGSAAEREWRGIRGGVQEAHDHVADDLNDFIKANARYDVRPPLPIEMSPSDVAPMDRDAPFVSTWEPLSVVEAVNRFADVPNRAVYVTQLDETLGAFVRAQRRREGN